jgi:phage/plasmid-associated DNA primase
MNNYEVCEVPTYKINYDNTQKTNKPIDSIVALLNNDLALHERLHKTDVLKLFVDVDKYKLYNTNRSLDTILDDICDYVGVTKHKLSYTTNNSVETGSHHIVIPQFFMSNTLQKKYWDIFRQKYNYHRDIDLSVYNCEKWFRLPNQSKDNVKGTEHIILQGNPEDFVLKYIEKSSLFVPAKNEEDKTDDESVLSEITLDNDNDNETIRTTSSQTIVTDTRKFTDTDYTEYKEYASLIKNIGFHTGQRNNRFKFITASKNIGIPLAIIKEQLRTTIDYDDKIVEETYNQHNKGDKLVGWNTIKTLAEENNKNAKQLLDDKYMKSYIFVTDLYNPLFTTALIADYFKLLYKGEFVCVDKIVYSYNGVFWEKDNDHSILTNFIDKKFVVDLLDYANHWTSKLTAKMSTATETENEEIKNKIQKINTLRNNINTMRKVSVRKSIMEDIMSFITNNKIEFDENPYLFAFNNCVFDLRIGQKIKPQSDQYISKTCGYDYDDNYDKKNVNDLNKLIAQIFPNNDIANYCKVVLSTGLCGIQQEYCFVFTGVGGNGKGVLNSLMMKMLGSYSYVLPSETLLTSIKTGANPELYNLNKARFVIASEPNSKMKIKCATLKTITGEPTLPVRDHYSSKVGASMSLTLVMEANDVPLLDEVNQAMMRRMRMVLFNSLYVDKATYDTLDDKTNVYIGDPYYKTNDFKNQYKQAMFQILLESFQEFHKNNNIIPDMPLECKNKCRDYMAVCDDIYGWFNCAYKKNDNADAISLTDVYKVFASSEFYSNLNKADKRNYNRKAFTEKIEKNIFLKRCIKLRNSTHNKVQLPSDSIVGWELINEDNILDEDSI